jgi:hypothetical protein
MPWDAPSRALAVVPRQTLAESGRSTLDDGARIDDLPGTRRGAARGDRGLGGE